MKISDIITFIKAGYSPAEITALESPSDVATLLSEGVKKEDIPACLELLSATSEESEKTQDVKEEMEKEKTSEDTTNYKVLYETLLKEKQQQNVRENMADDMQDNKKTIEDIVRSFM